VGETASSFIAGMSMTIASLMGMGLCICAYCFFREDVLAVVGVASGAKRKKRGAYGTLGVVTPTSASEGEDDEAPSASRGRKGGASRKGKGKEKEKRGTSKMGSLAPGYMRVRLETQALSLRKEIDMRDLVGEAEAFGMLREKLWVEFQSALKAKKMDHMLLLCESTAASEGATVWQLVTRDSDIDRVVGGGSLKITDKPASDSGAHFSVAFPVRNAAGESNGRGSGRKKSKGSSSAKGGERFADDDSAAVRGSNGERFADDEDDDAPVSAADTPAAAPPTRAALEGQRASGLEYTSDDERRSKRRMDKGQDKARASMLE